MVIASRASQNAPSLLASRHRLAAAMPSLWLGVIGEHTHIDHGWQHVETNVAGSMEASLDALILELKHRCHVGERVGRLWPFFLTDRAFILQRFLQRWA